MIHYFLLTNKRFQSKIFNRIQEKSKLLNIYGFNSIKLNKTLNVSNY